MINSLLSKFTYNPETAHPLIRSNREYFQDFDQDKSMADYDFVVLDMEMTGLNARKNEIVAIGAVRVSKMRIRIADTFRSKVKPEGEMPKDTTLIHRISPQKVEDSPSLEEVLPQFVEFLNNAVLVGHNVALDMSFLNRGVKKHLGHTLANPSVDTMRMAMALRELESQNYYDRYNLDVSYNLFDLGKEYNLPTYDRHDAFGDAMLTAYLFIYLAAKMAEKGANTLADLYKMGRGSRVIV